MRDIIEAMKERGASEAQLNSKTMAMVQDIIATEEEQSERFNQPTGGD